ncbi:hypothetical protein [Scytonema sp. NUACC21]
MTQNNSRIQEGFYLLQHEEWLKALRKLKPSAFILKHSKRIHLCGKSDLTKLALAQATCSEFNVTVTFKEV